MQGLLFHRIVILCVFFWFQACFVFGQVGYLKGKVSNGTENVPFISVVLGEQQVFTGINGEYSFTVNPGRYVLSIIHPEYETSELIVNINPGEIQTRDIILKPMNRLGEVVLLGSRSKIQRSNLNTAVPVDAFSNKELLQTGQVSLTQMLTFLAPSFNASGETLNEPVTLRGLDPDHLLILINGVRYHNMAWINGGNLKGQLGRGSVGNDLNSIPPSAIEKIEILRDGASAQFGSDAIAGVINIELKESTNKTTVNWQQGQFYSGDGEKYALGINHGITLNKKEQKGFLNLSADYRYQEPTYRGGQYDGTVYFPLRNNLDQDEKEEIINADNQIITERNFNRKNVLDQVGNSKFVVVGLSVNGAYRVTKNTEVLWTALINQRKVFREVAYRFPKDTRQINLDLFPDGFQPLSEPTTTDITLTSGVKGKLKNNWFWDFTGSIGTNTLRTEESNSNNASQSYLGVLAPTRFYNGKKIYEQLINNFNASKKFDGLTKNITTMSLSMGAEWRLERFYEKPGEEASWKNYDDTYRKQPGTGGISPEDAINTNRNNVGVYVDFETEFHDRLLLNFAGRYEYYNDFGGNLAGKFASRYKLTDRFIIRASVNNGFRAPSLQQRYTSTVSENSQNIGGLIVITQRGIFPNEHPVVEALGVPALTAEKSFNASGGFTLKIFKNIFLTTDAYWLQLRDRIVLSGTFFRNNNPTLDNILIQYPEFDQVGQVAFFSNAINTRTKGVDIVLQGNSILQSPHLNFSLAANFTQTRLYGDIKTAKNLPSDLLNTNSILNAEEKTKIEKVQPESKIILSINYEIEKFSLLIRNSRFGKTSIAPLIDANTGVFLLEKFSPKIITDLSVNYRLKSFLTVSAGANNLFNVYPDKIKNYENTKEGIRIYSPDGAPFGFNGGYYFMNAKFSF